MENTLDSIEKKANFKIIDILPSIIVGALFIWSVYIRFTKHYQLYTADYIGYSLVFIGTVVYLYNKKISRIFLTITFVIGTLNLYSFTPYHYVIGLGASLGNDSNTISPGIQPISLILLLINIIPYSSKKSIPNEIEEQKPEKIEVNNETVLMFKDKYSKKSIEELEIIANSNNYRDEARLAAKEMLQERKIKYENNN